MVGWIVWIVITSPFLATLGCVLWDARDRDKRSGLRPEKEPLAVAVREWFKAFGFIAASIAAVFAFWQFEVARERAESDRRPWIGLSNFAVDQRYPGEIDEGDRLAFLFWSDAKNYGATPAVHLNMGAKAFVRPSVVATASGDYWRESLGREREAMRAACANAESQSGEATIFPNDHTTLLGYVVVDSNLLDQYRTSFSSNGDAAILKAIVCVAYRSTIDGGKFHHTTELLDVDIVTNRSLSKVSSLTAASVKVSPGARVTGLAD